MIGCTSLVLNASDKTSVLARTMDFTIEMAENVIYTPKEKKITSSYGEDSFYISKLAFIGMGMQMPDGPVTFDGVNQAGLTAATLYFPGYASYKKVKEENRLAVSPDKIISFALANCETNQEVRRAFETDITIVDRPNPVLGLTTPLHYIFMDKSGNSLIVEPTENGIKIYDHSIGVMTNSPDYPWHENNLRNYLSINPHQYQTVNWLGKTLQPFSQGSGSFGLPGDYTPTSRFIRAAFLKNFIEKPKDEIQTINAAANILKSVSIPKGIVLTQENKSDYTCYSSYMSAQTQSYYFATYGNQRIRKVSLTEKLLSHSDYLSFPVKNNEDILNLN
ncbi:choloylglycine hydrolase family protein [Oenococcus oeni]|uniref:choloylglycine hydrolase family protein n=2 Tax=Oenococcus oeni TaxID=1247 RepID=UPI000277B792|nr:choloylglycine hydrolase family protein [Oenococcus oeni]AWW99481.1 linear amide C-N hydrolase [Oenococcus oeni]EJO06069.1 penicillin V acylase precursor [Oenococcus oeni AWRIB553]EKP87983.1 penicillin V acylase precursor [Oenococcus oeni DSM 20252 = AWRIB129]KEK02861.1 penicillin acylase [Oenococcus oeni]KER93507.1 penicillin acylase [Oenococcus oeni]